MWMFIKSWEQLPQNMQKEPVKEYYKQLSKKRFSLILKRFFDLFASVILLIILSPVFVFLSIWIKLDSSGPVFYRQERITQYGRAFKIYKFRTMVSNADKIGSLVTVGNDSRITKVGAKIRKCRLDEIPQLFNIFLGDMSFVGTRPEVQKYVDAYSDEMMATLLLPAGVTSLASITYKDEDEILNSMVDDTHTVDEIYINCILPEKMKLNLRGILCFSLWNDFKILINTILKVMEK